ncbi:MAG: twin-arginine translocase TatA/TatE family subunit [Candidatus Planktophila sp.]|jgi:sec-independent protein translocase protein TatB|nr:twin-arginine translocase TatA/TatE family subunit [Candidatus Planktophila sp.]
MFDFGFGEVIGLVVLALLLVGPERMPRVAADLGKMIRKVRSLTNTATAEIRENLGPGFEDLKPADLNPKTFIKRHVASVLDDEDEKERQNRNGASAFKPQIDPDLL